MPYSTAFHPRCVQPHPALSLLQPTLSSFHPVFIPFLPVHSCNLWTASGRRQDREDRQGQPDKSLVVKREDRGGGSIGWLTGSWGLGTVYYIRRRNSCWIERLLSCRVDSRDRGFFARLSPRRGRAERSRDSCRGISAPNSWGGGTSCLEIEYTVNIGFRIRRFTLA